nr:MAG: RNA-dependent RNA polymerase [Fort Crockett virus]
MATTDFGPLSVAFAEAFAEGIQEDTQRLLLNELTATAERTVLKSKLTEGIVTKIHNQAAEKLRLKKINIHINLSESDKRILNASFPQFHISYSNTNIEAHGFSHAHRILEYYTCLSNVGYTFTKDVRSSYDFTIKDVGGNLRFHIYRGFNSIHCCLPLLSHNDHQRMSAALVDLRSTSLKVNYQRRLINDAISPEHKIYCNNKSQHCKFTAPFLIAIHSLYDMTVMDIADSLTSARAERLVGTMFFSYDMLFNERGYIRNHNLSWVKRRKTRGYGYELVFNFDNDFQEPYVHDYDVYLSKLRTVFFFDSTRKNAYHLQIMSFINNILFINITRDQTGYAQRETIYRPVCIPRNGDEVVIRYYTPKVLGYNSFKHLKKQYITVPVQLYEKQLENLLTLSQADFTYQKSLEYASSCNNRTIINGVSVSQKSKVDIDTLHVFAFATYLYAYEKKYDYVRTMSIVKEEIDRHRKPSPFSAFVSSISDKFKAKIGAILDGWAQWFDSLFGCVDLTPSTIIQCMKYSPVVVNIAQELSDMLFPDSGTLLSPVFVDLVPPVGDSAPEKVEIKPKPMFDVSYTVAERPCSYADCDPAEVPGDGDCFFHSLVALGLSDCVDDCKTELLKYLPELNVSSITFNQQRDILSSRASSDSNNWADNVTIAIAASYYKCCLCIHRFDGQFELYGDKTQSTFHINYTPNHFRPILLGKPSNVSFVSIAVKAGDPEGYTSVPYLETDELFVNHPDYQDWCTKYSLPLPSLDLVKNRSYYKLRDILTYFKINVNGLRILDVGSGPGGFIKNFLDDDPAHIDYITHDDYPLKLSSTKLRQLPINKVPEYKYDLISYDAVSPSAQLQSFENNMETYVTYFPDLIDNVHSGGVMIIKYFLPQSGMAITFLDKIFRCFREVYLVRSSLSSLFNIEFYIIAIDRLDYPIERRVSLETLNTMRDVAAQYKQQLLTKGVINLSYDSYQLAELIDNRRDYYVSDNRGGYDLYKVKPNPDSPIQRRALVDTDMDQFVKLIEEDEVLITNILVDNNIPSKYSISPKNFLAYLKLMFAYVKPARHAILKILTVLPSLKRVSSFITLQLKDAWKRINFSSSSGCQHATGSSFYNVCYLCDSTYYFCFTPDLILSIDRVSTGNMVEFLRDFGFVLKSCNAVSVPPVVVPVPSGMLEEAVAIGKFEERRKDVEDDIPNKVLNDEPLSIIEDHFSDYQPKDYGLGLGAAFRELSDLWTQSVSAFKTDWELDAAYLRTNFSPLSILAHCARKSEPYFVCYEGKFYPYTPEEFSPMYVYDFNNNQLVRVGPDSTASELPKNFFVDKDLFVYLEPELVTKFGTKLDDIAKYSFTGKIEFITGPPGCGKTTAICNRYNPGQLILCATTAGVEDYVQKLNYPKRSKSVRTVYSYVLNDDSNYDTVYFDEVLMVHPGYVQLVLYLTKCKNIIMFGDYRQIPYYPRIAYEIKYAKLVDIVQPNQFIPVTYRCPQDVARFLQRYYQPDKFDSKNSVSKSIYPMTYSGDITELPIDHEAVYLTFMQDEKNQIEKNLGVRLYTIHEYQGKQDRHVILVRVNYKACKVYDSVPHWIVAMSRHTQSFRYYVPSTLSPPDKFFVELTDFINKGGYLLTKDYLPSYLKFVSTSDAPISSVGGHLFFHSSSLYDDRYVNILSKKTLKKFSIGPVDVYFGKRKIVVANGLDASVMDVFRLLGISHIHMPDYTKRFTPKQFSLFSKYNIKITIHSRNLTVISSDSVMRVLKKNLLPVVDVFRYSCDSLSPVITEYPVVTLPKIFAKINDKTQINYFSLNQCLYFTIIPDPCFPATTFRFSVSFSSTAKYQRYTKGRSVRDFVIYLQSFVSSYFSGIDSYNYSKDVSIVQQSDKIYTLENVSFVTNSVSRPYTIPDNVTPRLITGIGYDRPYNTNELLLALSKRNMAVPKSDTLYVYYSDAKYAFENMLKTFCDSVPFFPDLVVSSATVYEWLSTQDVSIQKQFTDLSIYDLPLNEYSVTIKKNPKPLLDFSVFTTYSALQTIVFSSKDYNSFFCPIFKLVKERLMSILKPNVMLFTDYSPEEFTVRLNKLGFDSSRFCHSLEIDLSKYDKSQQLFHLVIECYALSYFGVPDVIVKMWFHGHYYTRARDQQTKTVFTSFCQRKSGDPSTWLGNTLINLVMLADVHRPGVNDLIYLFSGDDSLVLSTHPVKLNVEYLKRKYNFDSKVLDYKYSLFCSKFIIRHSGLFYFLPDIFKMVVKLGRRDLKDKYHLEEYRVSFLDNIKALIAPESVLQELFEAIKERYPGIVIPPDLVDTLFLLASSDENFKKLYIPNREYDLKHGNIKDI